MAPSLCGDSVFYWNDAVAAALIITGAVILIICKYDKKTPDSTCKAGIDLLTLGLGLLLIGTMGNGYRSDGQTVQYQKDPATGEVPPRN